jgi:hypothetical protein
MHAAAASSRGTMLSSVCVSVLMARLYSPDRWQGNSARGEPIQYELLACDKGVNLTFGNGVLA